MGLLVCDFERLLCLIKVRLDRLTCSGSSASFGLAC